MNQQDLNRMQQRLIKEPGTPLWVWLFAVFSVVLSATVLARIGLQKKQIELAAEKAKLAAEAKHKKAEDLAAEGFEKLRMARREQLARLCRDGWDVPLFFMDKVVCVKREAIQWQKYDGNPEVDDASE